MLVTGLEQRRLLNSASSVYPAPVLDSDAAPMAPVIADIDGDGFNDVIVPHRFPLFVIKIHYGTANGSFDRVDSIPAPDPASVAVADFDGDGDLDLVTSQIRYAAKVSLIVNTGSRTFAPAIDITAANQYSKSIRAGDVTGDGIPDIVTVTEFQSAVVVLPGTGTGTFAAPISVPVTIADSSTLALADFNGDGLLDIITGGNSSVSFIRSLGAARFAPRTTFAAGKVTNIAVGDVNGDGFADFVASDAFGLGKVRLALGNPNGTVTITVVASTKQTDGIALADLNGDGKLDLIAGEMPTQPRLRIYSGDGAGGFSLAPVQPPDMRMSASFMAVGRLGPDAVPDFVITDSSTAFVAVFDPVASLRLIAAVPPQRSIAVGDFDGDGFDDVIGSGSSPASGIRMWRGGATNPLGTYVDQLTFQFLTVGVIHVADLDADGDLDCVLIPSGSSSLYLLKNDGLGVFTTTLVTHVDTAVWGIQTADWNGDGNLDMLLLGDQYVRMYAGTGIGTLSPSGTILLSAPRATSFDVGDVNADGNLDLVTSASDSTYNVTIRYGTGGGALGTSLTIPFTGALGAIKLADLNDDGRLDVVVTRTMSQQSNELLSRVGVVLQGQDGTFATPVEYTAKVYTHSSFTEPDSPIISVDADGDGDIDLIVPAARLSSNVAYSFTLLVNDGTGNFPEVQEFLSVESPYAFGVGDFNGDRRPDVVGMSFFANPGSLSLNQLPRDNAAPLRMSTSFDPRQSAMIAFNFDEPLDGSTVQPTDLVIKHLPTGQTFAASSVATANWGKTLRFTLPANLPDGDYEFRVNAGAIADRFGNALAAAVTYSGPNAFLLASDANRDRRVNFDDLLILAANYNQSPRNFGQGDFDYSGTVNFDDLLILAARYNAVLPGNVARAAPPPLSSPGPDREGDEGGGSEVGVLT